MVSIIINTSTYILQVLIITISVTNFEIKSFLFYSVRQKSQYTTMYSDVKTSQPERVQCLITRVEKQFAIN